MNSGRLHYRYVRPSDVNMINPDLPLHEGAHALLHIYPGGRLYLHLPGQWRPTMFLANTTVPWTSEGLLYSDRAHHHLTSENALSCRGRACSEYSADRS